VEALERAAASGVLVIQSTRVPAGRVPVVGSLVARGWVAAGDLPPWKARILVRLALAAGITGRKDLQALFDE
jgi:L-asparaginase